MVSSSKLKGGSTYDFVSVEMRPRDKSGGAPYALGNSSASTSTLGVKAVCPPAGRIVISNPKRHETKTKRRACGITRTQSFYAVIICGAETTRQWRKPHRQSAARMGLREKIQCQRWP